MFIVDVQFVHYACSLYRTCIVYVQFVQYACNLYSICTVYVQFAAQFFSRNIHISIDFLRALSDWHLFIYWQSLVLFALRCTGNICQRQEFNNPGTNVVIRSVSLAATRGPVRRGSPASGPPAGLTLAGELMGWFPVSAESYTDKSLLYNVFTVATRQDTTYVCQIKWVLNKRCWSTLRDPPVTPRRSTAGWRWRQRCLTASLELRLPIFPLYSDLWAYLYFRYAQIPEI